MTKEETMKARVEKNLKVLKLLKDNDANINAAEKRAILNEYTGWGGMREAIYTPSVYRQLNPSWNVFEIKYKYLEDLSDLKNYMRSALRGCRV